MNSIAHDSFTRCKPKYLGGKNCMIQNYENCLHPKNKKYNPKGNRSLEYPGDSSLKRCRNIADHIPVIDEREKTISLRALQGIVLFLLEQY
jgi:hypothetical protein